MLLTDVFRLLTGARCRRHNRNTFGLRVCGTPLEIAGNVIVQLYLGLYRVYNFMSESSRDIAGISKVYKPSFYVYHLSTVTQTISSNFP